MGHPSNTLHAPTCFHRNIRNIRSDIRNTRNIRDYCPEHLLTNILLLCTFLPSFLFVNVASVCMSRGYKYRY